jgi:hypothetical protein
MPVSEGEEMISTLTKAKDVEKPWMIVTVHLPPSEEASEAQ